MLANISFPVISMCFLDESIFVQESWFSSVSRRGFCWFKSLPLTEAVNCPIRSIDAQHMLRLSHTHTILLIVILTHTILLIVYWCTTQCGSSSTCCVWGNYIAWMPRLVQLTKLGLLRTCSLMSTSREENLVWPAISIDTSHTFKHSKDITPF